MVTIKSSVNFKNNLITFRNWQYIANGVYFCGTWVGLVICVLQYFS